MHRFSSQARNRQLVTCLLCVFLFPASLVHAGPAKKAAEPTITPVPAYAVQFEKKSTYTFLKVGDVWLALRVKDGQPNTVEQTLLNAICDQTQSGKELISDQGIFVSLGTPSQPSIDAKTGKTVIKWVIEATYDDTGRSATQTATIFVKKDGRLGCSHADNR